MLSYHDIFTTNSGIITFLLSGADTLSKKSSWTLIKNQLSQKCFILGKLKAYYVKQVYVLFNSTPNLKESIDKIKNRVLIIWMETGTFLKVANEAIQLYRASDRWADMCVDEW